LRTSLKIKFNFFAVYLLFITVPFIQLNRYLINNRKLIPSSEFDSINGEANDLFTRKEKFILRFMGADSMTNDELLREATRRFNAHQIENGRLLCRKIINISPNYTDARLLLGNSYIWQGNFKDGRSILEVAFKRNPNSEQTLVAIIKSFEWEGVPCPDIWLEQAKRFSQTSIVWGNLKNNKTNEKK